MDSQGEPPDGNVDQSNPSTSLTAAAPPKRVVFVVDWPNLRAGLRDKGLTILPERLNRRIQTLGIPWSKEVFCDVSQLDAKLQSELRSEGFTLIHCPTIPDPSNHVRGKETVDAIMIGRMEQLAEIVDFWDIMVIATLDRDFQCVLQRLRDKAGSRGKKILIFTPTLDTRSMLADHCDGVITYISDEEEYEIEKKALAKTEALLQKNVYTSTEQEVKRCLDVLGIIIETFDEKLRINSGNFGFSVLCQHLYRNAKLRAHRLSFRNAERFLEIMRRQEILLREEGKGDHCYRLAWEHPFVIYTLQPKEEKSSEERAVAKVIGIIQREELDRRTTSSTGS